MRNLRWISTVIVPSLVVLVSACGTPREKTAPCKRPASLSSYANPGDECGPMRPLNPDRAATLAAIQELAPVDEE